MVDLERMDVNGGFEPNGKEFFMWLAWAVCAGYMITGGPGVYREF